MNALNELKETVYRCHHCRACNLTDSDEIGWHKVCPTYEAYPFEHYAAGGRNSIVRAWFEGLIEEPEGIVESIYSCLECGACREICQAYTEIPFPMPDGVDTPRIMRAMRGELAARGVAPDAIKKLCPHGTAKTDIFRGSRAIKRKFSEEQGIPREGETLFFGGCSAFSKDHRQTTEAAIKILTSTGTGIAFLSEEEWCCGMSQYAAGDMELFKEAAAHNLEAIKESGAERVVTNCAACYHALSTVYPRVLGEELPFRVFHTTQYLSQLLNEKKIVFTNEVKATVTYHDPCRLGRGSKVYEAPRDVLKQVPGLKLLEMEKSREQAWCCGGGGVVRLAYPELTAKIAQERVRQAGETGAGVIVTACPHCNSVLETAANSAGLECKDLIDLAAEAM